MSALEERKYKVNRLKDRISSIRETLQSLEGELQAIENITVPHPDQPPPTTRTNSTHATDRKIEKFHSDQVNWTSSSILSNLEYRRYGRQMIMPEVGLEGVLLRTLRLGEGAEEAVRQDKRSSSEALC